MKVISGGQTSVGTPEWAAKELSVSRSTVYELVKKGKLGHFKVGLTGKRIRIGRDHIMQYWKDCEHPVKPQSQIQDQPAVEVASAARRVVV